MASPLTFDPSVVEIFTSLSSGAMLLILDELVRTQPRRLAALLTDVHHVTVLQVFIRYILVQNNASQWRHLSQPLGGLTFPSSYSTTTSLRLLSPCCVMCDMPNKRQY